MSQNRYLVIFSGKIKPNLDIETVKSNLVLDMNMEPEKAKRLFTGHEVLLKRCEKLSDAELLASKLNKTGAICYVKDSIQTVKDSPERSGNESSIMQLMKNLVSGTGNKSNRKSFSLFKTKL